MTLTTHGPGRRHPSGIVTECEVSSSVRHTVWVSTSEPQYKPHPAPRGNYLRIPEINLNNSLHSLCFCYLMWKYHVFNGVWVSASVCSCSRLFCFNLLPCCVCLHALVVGLRCDKDGLVRDGSAEKDTYITDTSLLSVASRCTRTGWGYSIPFIIRISIKNWTRHEEGELSGLFGFPACRQGKYITVCWALRRYTRRYTLFVLLSSRCS